MALTNKSMLGFDPEDPEDPQVVANREAARAALTTRIQAVREELDALDPLPASGGYLAALEAEYEQAEESNERVVADENTMTSAGIERFSDAYADSFLAAPPYRIPEITGILKGSIEYPIGRAIGPVYGHERFTEGFVIRTSPIVKRHILIETESGSFYLLED